MGVREDEKTIVASFITGEGSGKGELGSFKLIKQEKGNEEIKLKGAKFNLYKGANKGRLIGEITTD